MYLEKRTTAGCISFHWDVLAARDYSYNLSNFLYIRRMATADQIRNNLIDRLSTINNVELLNAIAQLLEASSTKNDVVKLLPAQKELLQLSEEDIKYGRLISDEDLNKEEDEWLNE